MHSVVSPFARPIPSVRPSVRDKSEYCENGESIGYYTMGSPLKVTTGLLRGPIANPLRPALLPNWGLTTSSQNGARCNSSLCWQAMGTYTIALPKGTIVDPLGAPLPLERVVKKLNSIRCKIVMDIWGLCTLIDPPPVWHYQCPPHQGEPFPPNFWKINLPSIGCVVGFAHVLVRYSYHPDKNSQHFVACCGKGIR